MYVHTYVCSFKQFKEKVMNAFSTLIKFNPNENNTYVLQIENQLIDNYRTIIKEKI